jgi:hypothetical protein
MSGITTATSTACAPLARPPWCKPRCQRAHTRCATRNRARRLRFLSTHDQASLFCAPQAQGIGDLGHANISTTSIYLHTEDDARHDATAAGHRVGWRTP